MDFELVKRKKIVSICETQPLTIFGLEHLLETVGDLKFGRA